MQVSSKWAYANARLRAYLGTLFGATKFNELCRCSLEECVSRIADSPPDGIEWPQMDDPYSDEIGSLLYLAYEKHFLKLASFLDEPHRSVFILTLEHVAVDDLKHFIRRIVGGHESARARRHERYEKGHYLALGRSSLVPGLEGVSTLDQLDAALADTSYAAPYRMGRSSFDDTGEILAFEVALDLDFHRRLDRAIIKLPSPDDRQVDRLFRRECDIKNLGWILRYRFEFQLKEVEIFNYTLSVGYELDDDLVMALARLGSPNQVIEKLSHLPMGRFLADNVASDSGKATVIDIEGALDRYWEHIHRSALCITPFGLLPFLCYRALKELERDRLERIVVGLQLGLDPEEIIESLWLPMDGAHA